MPCTQLPVRTEDGCSCSFHRRAERDGGEAPRDERLLSVLTAATAAAGANTSPALDEYMSGTDCFTAAAQLISATDAFMPS